MVVQVRDAELPAVTLLVTGMSTVLLFIVTVLLFIVSAVLSLLPQSTPGVKLTHSVVGPVIGPCVAAGLVHRRCKGV